MGTVGIETPGTIDVNMIDVEAAERVSEEVLYRERPGIITGPVSGRVAQRAELDADNDAVAVSPGKRFADQHLIVTHSIIVAGVEERDAGIESGVDRGDALAAIGGAVKV